MKMGSTKGRNRYSPGDGALFVTVAVAFILITAIAAMGLFFKITDITVEGAEKYTAGQIIAVSGIEKDNSVFFLNSSAAEIAIKSALPYVDTVKVIRHLPGTVTIQITESVSAAYIASGGSYYILDLNGRILEKSSYVPQGVEIRGAIPEDPQAGKTISFGKNETPRVTALTDYLKTASKYQRLDKMAWIDMTNLSAITFDYNGYRFNFGADDELDLKFGTLLRDFLKDHTDPGNGQSVYYDAKIKGLHFLL